ncbi:hypothetical protein [Bacillus subtilis]|uniref:hypothetical protein n=1 Tax=Bacillus subtilis TaxID=1423 RepID=UPI003AEFDC9C
MFFSPSVVNVGGFKINTMDRGSSLTLGPYQQVDYFLSAKINQGFGEENGDFTPLVVPISNVLDADLAQRKTVWCNKNRAHMPCSCFYIKKSLTIF